MNWNVNNAYVMNYLRVKALELLYIVAQEFIMMKCIKDDM
jgi:hypothetical protein